jgi:hypothetical protein
MAETKFTPGPWLAEERSGGSWRRSGLVLAVNDPEAEEWRAVKIVAQVDDRKITEMNQEEFEANALLIGAAPDMYGELLALRNFLVGLGSLGSMSRAERIDAILAKARGESHG